MSDIRVLVDTNGQIFPIACCMCGSTFRLGDPQPCLADDNWERICGCENGSDICPDCFDTLDLHGPVVLADELRIGVQKWAEQERQRIDHVVANVLATAEELRRSSVTIRRTGQTCGGTVRGEGDAPAIEMLGDAHW